MALHKCALPKRTHLHNEHRKRRVAVGDARRVQRKLDERVDEGGDEGRRPVVPAKAAAEVRGGGLQHLRRGRSASLGHVIGSEVDHKCRGGRLSLEIPVARVTVRAECLHQRKHKQT